MESYTSEEERLNIYLVKNHIIQPRLTTSKQCLVFWSFTATASYLLSCFVYSFKCLKCVAFGNYNAH